MDAQKGALLPPGSAAHLESANIGQTISRTFVVKNTGAQALPLAIFMEGDHASEFTLPADLPATLEAGASYSLTVAFKPSAAGTRSARLLFHENWALSWTYQIRLSGEGVPTPQDMIFPAACIAHAGESLTLEARPRAGATYTYQWLFKKKAIRGATGRTLTLNSVQAKQAGSYQVKIIQGKSYELSGTAQVGVIGHASRSLAFVPGKNVSIVQPAAGPNIKLAWILNESAPPAKNGIKGKNSTTLTLPKIQPEDAGRYTCYATLGDVQRPGVSFELRPMMPPSVTTSQYQWQVGRDVTDQLAFDGDPAQFFVTGFPPGVLLNRKTGQFSGKPTISGDFTLRVTAKNPAGTSEPRLIPVQVAALGLNEKGSFSGLIRRDSSLGAGHGGVIKLMITNAGAYTGTLTLKTSTGLLRTQRFMGKLTWDDDDRAVAQAQVQGPSGNVVLKARLTHTIGELVIGEEVVGECRLALLSGSAYTNNTVFVPVDADPTVEASGTARTQVTARGMALTVGRLNTKEGSVTFTGSAEQCLDTDDSRTFPLHCWLPNNETFTGWMPAIHDIPRKDFGLLNWNADAFHAGNLNFQPETTLEPVVTEP